jgi:AraC-like DNA-binding protein
MGEWVGTVDSAVGVPAAPLAAFVRGYHGYHYRGFTPGIHLGLPSRDLTVVVSLGSPTRLAAMPDPNQAPGDFVALASGLSTRPAVIAHDGEQYGVQLALTPAGARSLLGAPAGALGPTVVSLDNLLGPEAWELADRLASAPTWEERFGVLDDMLSARAAGAARGAGVARAARDGRRAEPPAEVAYAWRRIVESRGTARVGDLAVEVGWSRRHLGERFAREYGLTPRDVARVVRFERSHRLLRKVSRPTLAEVATACGYYDQAHLARDWNDLAGCPPSQWLAREELPFVQDEPAGVGADSGV